MPYSIPTAGDLHVSKPLSNFSQKWMQDSDMFVALRATPNSPVSNQFDEYYEFDRADFFRDEGDALERADGTESVGGGFGVALQPYYAKVYAFHHDITDRKLANQDGPIRLERSATQFVTQKLMIRREVIWHDLFFAAASWGGNTSDPGDWTGVSTPIIDIDDVLRLVHGGTGLRPNRITFGRAAWDAFKNNDDVLARVEGGATTSTPALVMRQLISALFEVDEVLISNGVVNTAARGAAENTAFIGGDSVLIHHSPMGMALDQPSATAQFSWTGFMGATPNGMRIKKFRHEPTESERVEGQMAFDYRVTAPELGFLLTGVTS